MFKEVNYLVDYGKKVDIQTMLVYFMRVKYCLHYNIFIDRKSYIEILNQKILFYLIMQKKGNFNILINN